MEPTFVKNITLKNHFMADEMAGEEISVYKSKYVDNGNTALILMCENGEPFGTATVNTGSIPDGHVLIKDYSENEGIYQDLVDNGVISMDYTTMPVGFVEGKLTKFLM